MSTGIQWTDTTWNPVVGCAPVSPGCLNCYAATMARRLEAMGRAEYAPRVEPERQTMPDAFGVRTIPAKTIRIAEVRGGRAVFAGDVRTVPERLPDPLKWRKPRRVFVNSMSDLFHEAVPDEFIDRVFAVMALCPQHTFQVLTKRPERMAKYLNAAGISVRMACAARDIVGRTLMGVWRGVGRSLSGGRVEEAIDRFDGHGGVLPNVWLGASVERQQEADERIPHLLRCPAAVRFLSCEPLLGEVRLDIPRYDQPDGSTGWAFPGGGMDGVDWVIVGGESGPKASPCNVGWIRGIVRQCRQAKVPVFVKQLGKHPRELAGASEPMPMAWTWDDGGEHIERWYKPTDRKGGNPAEWPEDLRVREWPVGAGGAA